MFYSRVGGFDHQDSGRQYVDILIETSKTGHARYTGAVGVSRSGVDLARYLQSYWNASGIDTLTTTAGGLTIRRGDRWTVRLNLLGFDSRRLDVTTSSSGSSDPLLVSQQLGMLNPPLGTCATTSQQSVRALRPRSS